LFVGLFLSAFSSYSELAERFLVNTGAKGYVFDALFG